MKNGIVPQVLLGLGILFLVGCSQDQTPQPNLTHPQGWVQTSGKVNHGDKVLAAGSVACASCHGDDYSGGTSEVSCFKCHTSYPHKSGWLQSGSAQFHGGYLGRVNYSTTQCQTCHGANLAGGPGKTPCTQCHALYPHDANWNKTGDAQFHGAFAKSVNWDLSSCKPCHGDQFQGGPGKAPCTACHASYPHNKDWLLEDTPDYHGAWLKSRQFRLEECQACHGDHLQGGDGKQACNACHQDYPHSSGFQSDASSSQFHGSYLKGKGYEMISCTACHGADYQGGSSGRSCYPCHDAYPHPSTWRTVGEGDTHISYLRARRHDLRRCQACHGSDYAGGTSGSSCHACHTTPQGPESCTLCHGNTPMIHPPKDTQGNTVMTAMGVGRHQFHVADKKYTCLLCHLVPATFAAPGHVYDDNTPGHAEVSSLWQWNPATATCETGCHANNPDKNFIWNH